MYIGVCDGNMEEGSLRCDANVSVRRKGVKGLGTKTEIKNVNSFKFIYKALEYEIKRHVMLLETGKAVTQETRLFDSNRNVTYSMRSKEEAHDYRYFPDPDLLPVSIDEKWVEQIRQNLPELPDQRIRRYVEQLEIPEYDAGVLTASRDVADYFEECLSYFNKPKLVSNWIMTEVLRELKSEDEIKSFNVSPKMLCDLLNLIEAGTISGKIAKEVLGEMVLSGKGANEIISDKGIRQISDLGEIESVIKGVMENNPDQVARYRAGEEKLIGFFVGQVMKATQGKANPKIVNEALKKSLSEG